MIIHNPITDHAQLKNVTTSQHHVKTAGKPIEKPMVSNSYVVPGWAWNSADTTSKVAGTVFIPIDISASISFDRIAVDETSGSSGTARLGYYNSATVDGQVYPTTLITDAGTVSLATTGIKEITIDWTPDAGIYYLAYSNASAAYVSGCDEGNTFTIPVAGVSNSSSSFDAQYNMPYSETDYVTAGLPSDVTTGVNDYFLSPKYCVVFLRFA